MSTDPKMQEADAQLVREFPLPFGCTVSRYVGDMREVVQYTINNDAYAVRYDWLEAGKRTMHRGEDIHYFELQSKSIDDAVRLRLVEVLKSRGVIA